MADQEELGIATQKILREVVTRTPGAIQKKKFLKKSPSNIRNRPDPTLKR